MSAIPSSTTPRRATTTSSISSQSIPQPLQQVSPRVTGNGSSALPLAIPSLPVAGTTTKLKWMLCREPEKGDEAQPQCGLLSNVTLQASALSPYNMPITYFDVPKSNGYAGLALQCDKGIRAMDLVYDQNLQPQTRIMCQDQGTISIPGVYNTLLLTQNKPITPTTQFANHGGLHPTHPYPSPYPSPYANPYSNPSHPYANPHSNPYASMNPFSMTGAGFPGASGVGIPGVGSQSTSTFGFPVTGTGANSNSTVPTSQPTATSPTPPTPSYQGYQGYQGMMPHSHPSMTSVPNLPGL